MLEFMCAVAVGAVRHAGVRDHRERRHEDADHHDAAELTARQAHVRAAVRAADPATRARESPRQAREVIAVLSTANCSTLTLSCCLQYVFVSQYSIHLKHVRIYYKNGF